MDLQPQLLQIPVYSQGNRERNILGLTGQPAWSKGTIKSRYSERVCLRTIIRLRAIEEVTQHQLRPPCADVCTATHMNTHKEEETGFRGHAVVVVEVVRSLLAPVEGET